MYLVENQAHYCDSSSYVEDDLSLSSSLDDDDDDVDDNDNFNASAIMEDAYASSNFSSNGSTITTTSSSSSSSTTTSSFFLEENDDMHSYNLKLERIQRSDPTLTEVALMSTCNNADRLYEVAMALRYNVTVTTMHLQLKNVQEMNAALGIVLALLETNRYYQKITLTFQNDAAAAPNHSNNNNNIIVQLFLTAIAKSPSITSLSLEFVDMPVLPWRDMTAFCNASHLTHWGISTYSSVPSSSFPIHNMNSTHHNTNHQSAIARLMMSSPANLQHLKEGLSLFGPALKHTTTLESIYLELPDLIMTALLVSIGQNPYIQQVELVNCSSNNNHKHNSNTTTTAVDAVIIHVQLAYALQKLRHARSLTLSQFHWNHDTFVTVLQGINMNNNNNNNNNNINTAPQELVLNECSFDETTMMIPERKQQYMALLGQNFHLQTIQMHWSSNATTNNNVLDVTRLSGYCARNRCVKTLFLENDNNNQAAAILSESLSLRLLFPHIAHDVLKPYKSHECFYNTVGHGIVFRMLLKQVMEEPS